MAANAFQSEATIATADPPSASSAASTFSGPAGIEYGLDGEENVGNDIGTALLEVLDDGDDPGAVLDDR